MNGYLLDTNVALIALTEPNGLKAVIRKAILAGPNFISVVSFWEVLLKNIKGTLDVEDPRSWWTDALDQLAATPLALRPDHVAEVCNLPAIHKDPFDRILVGQSAVENLQLVTTDGEISLYASSRVRIVC